jgi:hypothetical protein
VRFASWTRGWRKRRRLRKVIVSLLNAGHWGRDGLPLGRAPASATQNYFYEFIYLFSPLMHIPASRHHGVCAPGQARSKMMMDTGSNMVSE